MRAPKSSTWFISVILAVLGILLYLGIIKIPLLMPYNFWIVAVALFSNLKMSLKQVSDR